MTLDPKLQARLEALAAAVPINVAAPRAAATAAVQAGPSSRALALGFGPVVVAIALIAFATGAGFGPFARPGVGSAGPVSQTVREGPFELTLSAPKGRYAAGEPVEATATLTFRGPASSVRIAHGLGALGGPIGFGTREPVLGAMALTPIVATACAGSTLEADAPLTVPFAKSGASTGDEVDSAVMQAYFADPVLRLQPGTWHLYATASFRLEQCTADANRYALTAEITIVVPDDLGAVPPAATFPPTPEPAMRPVSDDTQEGPIQLTLTSPHGLWTAGEPIEVVAGLANGGGGEPMTLYGGSGGPVAFWLEQLDGPVRIDPIVRADCVPQVTLSATDPERRYPFTKTGTVEGADGDPFWTGWFEDPVLRLPAGRWAIHATTEFDFSCGGGDGPSLRPTIVIVVVP